MELSLIIRPNWDFNVIISADVNCFFSSFAEVLFFLNQGKSLSLSKTLDLNQIWTVGEKKKNYNVTKISEVWKSD